jgi:hypothetical protein
MSTFPSIWCLPSSKALLCSLLTLVLAGEASARREWDASATPRTESNDQAASGVPRTDYFWAQQSDRNAGVDQWKAGQHTNISAGGNASGGLVVAGSSHQLAPGIMFQEKALTITRGVYTLTTTAGENGIILDTNFGHGTTSNLTNIPEPGAWSMVALGVFLLFARYRILAPQR